ncbi:DUF2911 domain-containing protein [Anditalea andensis]|uniref:DUF2911 domain-containing protein n=1 Tax=Anditalea andensis TaxID=1048983 RepID=A0A074L292_9BACT|nr:DUF2911 domain-containing protein [Anditalea andensis]KEO73988.1 hypothetical protein EL17_07495 [Anditalea andensis]
MKKTSLLKTGILSAFLSLFAIAAMAQEEKPSPARTAEGTINSTQVTIKYSSPAVKGRTIWGEVVPMGKVWRAGANEATIVEFGSDVSVQGQALPAGKYSLFIIPDAGESTFIFNKQTGQWGTQYDQSQDQLRVKVASQESSSFEERLVYEVKSSGIEVRWAEAKAMVRVE